MLHRRHRPNRQGYVMLVGLTFIAALSIIGATSLSLAGIDQRVAMHTRRHTVAKSASHAAVIHATRRLAMTDLASGTSSGFLTGSAGDGIWDDASVHPVPDYTVDAIYRGCGPAPVGFSADMGRNLSVRADFFEMRANAEFAGELEYPARAESSGLVRKVVMGACL